MEGSTGVSESVGSPPHPPEGEWGDTRGYKLLLDVPSRQPELGFSHTANALAQIIVESDPQFAIGIFGGWGSGKTTLMRAIEDQLDSTRVISVRFSAWRYEKEEHLIVPLLDAVREELLSWSEKRGTDGKAARRTAVTVGKVTRSILAGLSLRAGLPNALELSFDANKALQAGHEYRRRELEARIPRSFYHASFRALSDAFAEFIGEQADRRIVVFVDDLDRCLPESALQVLESMKLFFDLQGFVFVVGLDQDIVEDVIDAKYGRDARTAERTERARTSRVSGSEYVKKIFQLPYRLSPVAPDHLDAFLSATYTEAGIPDDQREELRKRVEHLRYVSAAGVNPREIKRYINAYTLQRKISDRLDPDVVLTLQTIAFRHDWSQVQEAILAYGRLFIEVLGRLVGVRAFPQPSALQELDPDLLLPDSFLEYVAPGRPGNEILSCDKDGRLVHEVDKYIYRGEAVRTAQDPALLDVIRFSGTARRLLTEATQADTVDERTGLIEQGWRALEQVGSSTYLEFGWGSIVMREFVLHDVNACKELHDRLLNPERPAELQEQDLNELNRLARSISERLLQIYRTGEARQAWPRPQSNVP
jgi:hypothetical protein